MTRVIGVTTVAVALSVLAGCGGGSDKKSSTPTTAKATTATTAKNSGTAPPTTSAKISPASATDLPKGPTYKTSSGPSGSGCSPPKGTSLPAGWWAGEIKKVDGTAIDLDVVCYFTGGAAVKAAKEDKAPAPTDDVYIRNQSPTTFRETFASASVPASCVGDANKTFGCSIGPLLSLYGSGNTTGQVGGQQVVAFPTVWVHVGKGGADYLYQQFHP